jgi:hypothetical protein
MDFISALLIGFAIGLGFAWFDQKKGNTWYRAWYKLTHKEALNEDSDLTFLKGQPFSGRLVPATLLSLMVALIFKLTGDLNLILILLYAGLMMAGILTSFYLFPFFMKRIRPQIKNVQKTIQKIDEIEESMSKVEPPKAEPEKIEKKEENDDDKKDDKDWRGGVKDFLDK